MLQGELQSQVADLNLYFHQEFFQRAPALASTSFMSSISTGEPVKIGKASVGLPPPSLSPSASSNNVPAA